MFARAGDSAWAKSDQARPMREAVARESYSGVVDHHRVVSKPHILECVGNNHGFTAIDDVSAKGGVTRRLLGIKPQARFEPLSVFIN